MEGTSVDLGHQTRAMKISTVFCVHLEEAARISFLSSVGPISGVLKQFTSTQGVETQITWSSPELQDAETPRSETRNNITTRKGIDIN